VLFQAKQEGNEGRAVATVMPLLVVTVLLVFVGAGLLRRSPVFAAGRGGEPRAADRRPSRRAAGALLVVGVLALSVVHPLAGVASWAGQGGESAAQGSAPPGAAPAAPGRRALFDFSGTLDANPGSRELRDRWLKTGVAAAFLALLMAVPIARAAVRGGRVARAAALIALALPLAVPGLVLSIGTLILWRAAPAAWLDQGVLRSALALGARFLPLALLASWLALRRTPRAQEEAARLLGAGRLRTALRVWGPQAAAGLSAAWLLVLVFALRELDTVMLIDNRILPMTLYSNIHFNRMADEANLLFLCLGILLAPALLGALLLGLRRRS
jgi:ABC-type Fe3+ transport system permease subunit